MKQQTFYYELTEWQDPEFVFVSLYGDKQQAFWLDSSNVDESSRFSYMGEAMSVIRYSLSETTEDIFSSLEKKLQMMRIQKTSVPFDFVGGYVGYFGYELKKLCGFSSRYISEYPDSLWYFVEKYLVFDHKKQVLYLACLATNKQEADAWMSQMKDALQKKQTKKKQHITVSPSVLQLELSKQQYFDAIDICKTFIKNGESYEVCLTNRLRGSVKKDPLELYRVLRKVNPAPYAAYFRDGDFTILCSSPERFLKIDQEGWVEAKPMKGTISRSTDPTEDHKLATQLRTSEKDRAENLMIVDLVRNDLGKVCEIGSVEVSKLMEIETYQTVHQMVSTIQGKLSSTVSPLACIKSCFPGGSMTGAPKKRTIEILDAIEKSSRGVYSGALGFLSVNGAIDLNIIIRTIVIQKEQATIGVGGAILYQSDPQKEYEEMLLKAQALQEALT